MANGKLSDDAIRAPNLTGKREKRSDGDGLFLLVTPTGRRSWALSYRWDGTQRTLPLGKFPAMTAAEARLLAERARVAVDRGEDPGLGTKRAAVAQAKVDRAKRFDTVAGEWFATQVAARRDPRYAARVWSRVEADLLPALGDKAVDQIAPADVIAALRAVEQRGAIYSARTIGRYASGIFRFARATHGLKDNPAEGIGDALRPTPPGKSQPSLAPSEVCDFYAALQQPHGDEELTRLALELTMHTVLRSGELRGGRWSEIQVNEWHVPAGRMKMKRAHIVPLSRQAMALLARLRQITGNGPLMFPGRRPGHTISENTVLFCIYGLGFKGRASGHGWRATFSTWAHEGGRWPSEWIEACLAHADSNKVRAAYNKATWLDQRREILQAWSDWLDTEALLPAVLPGPAKEPGW